MTILTTYNSINRKEWEQLLSQSTVATWFQTPAAYQFFAAQKRMTPFVFAVCREGELKGVCVGYHSFRAVIYGGPALADDATIDEVSALMTAVKTALKRKVIYIEQRNFNDYSRWCSAFEQAGFSYEPHLNFHVDTSCLDVVHNHLSKNRHRDIRTSLRDGATIIQHPDEYQVEAFYVILRHLYKTKVKTPLPPLSFFMSLYHHPDGRFLLVSYEGQIVGGVVCIVWQNRCVYEWYVAGMDAHSKSVFPSSLATYAGLKYAAEHACPRFDMMGAGRPDEPYGVRDFKARFGGQLVEHGRYKLITAPLLFKLGEWGVKIRKHL